MNSTPSVSHPSPYLQYQPYDDVSQYIIPNAEPGHQRGRFELAFSLIGGSVITGAMLGGTLGTVQGLKLLKDSPSFSVKRTQMLNSAVKGSTQFANAFGVVALTYSSIAVALSLSRTQDDNINTITAGTLTGLVTAAITNKQNTRQKLFIRSGVGAAVGLAASLIYSKLFGDDERRKY